MLKRPHPLLRLLGGPSLFGEILSETQSTPLATCYSSVPGALTAGRAADFDLVRPVRCPSGPLIANAVVSRRGVVFQSFRPSRFSSFYPYLKPGVVKDEWRATRRAPTFKGAASFVSQQLVYKGSYGDYWDEFLTTLCARRGQLCGPVLLADNFAAPFASEDLSEMGVESVSIPDSGLRVERLRILTPAQFFNNYLPENIAALHACFPGRVCPAEQRANPFLMVYLSRRAFERPGFSCGGKVNRTIRNEQEVEGFLEARGFRIVFPHQVGNAGIREALRGAHTVVAPHGAALFHTVWSPPARVVELAHPDWFLPSFIKLCHAMGVPSHRVVVADDGVVPLPALARALDLTR
jgi:capsular polysaccharide biosynthesis protein